MVISDIIKQSQDNQAFSLDQVVEMLTLPPDSQGSYQIMAEANRISKELTGNKAEVHAQFALNLSPCPKNCKFCSFAMTNGIFTQSTKITPEKAVSNARQFETDGANAIFIMTTATYDFSEFLEVSAEIKRNLKPETIMIANIGDQDEKHALLTKKAGYSGVYHALRLREGSDTSIPPERRKRSIEAFKSAGLKVGTCVEPVGPEHSNEDLAELILFTAEMNPSYSGAARRISLPKGELNKYGMITELRMAQIVAVTRLAMPRSVYGNCTHEPCTLGALGGANLFWAETGANPRDYKEQTEEGRGHTVEQCRAIFAETDWNVRRGPSVYYGN